MPTRADDWVAIPRNLEKEAEIQEFLLETRSLSESAANFVAERVFAAVCENGDESTKALMTQQLNAKRTQSEQFRSLLKLLATFTAVSADNKAYVMTKLDEFATRKRGREDPLAETAREAEERRRMELQVTAIASAARAELQDDTRAKQVRGTYAFPRNPASWEEACLVLKWVDAFVPQAGNNNGNSNNTVVNTQLAKALWKAELTTFLGTPRTALMQQRYRRLLDFADVLALTLSSITGPVPSHIYALLNFYLEEVTLTKMGNEGVAAAQYSVWYDQRSRNMRVGMLDPTACLAKAEKKDT